MTWTDILTTIPGIWIKVAAAAFLILVIAIFFLLVFIYGRLSRRGADPIKIEENKKSWQRVESEKKTAETDKKESKNGKFIVETVIISMDKNLHTQARVNELNYIYDYGGNSYKIHEGALYRKKLGLIDQLLYKLRKIEAHYIGIYWEGEQDPAAMPKNIVNPQILARVRTSRALGRALKEMFKGSIMDNKGLIFIIVVFLAIALFILRAQGYI